MFRKLFLALTLTVLAAGSSLSASSAQAAPAIAGGGVDCEALADRIDLIQELLASMDEQDSSFPCIEGEGDSCGPGLGDDEGLRLMLEAELNALENVYFWGCVISPVGGLGPVFGF